MRLATLFFLLAASSALTAEKPKVLLLGDSISIGYTPTVKTLLADEAEVSRPMRNEKAAENCQYTAYGVENLDRWLGDTKWSVIHFNFGLHDLKYIDDKFPRPPKVKERDQAIKKNPAARQLASVEEYAANLEKIVLRLKQTDARLLFCTTTPVPPDAGGRIADDSIQYNKAALAVMKKHGVPVNDLHAFAQDRLAEIQRPRDVHFTKEGSAVLGAEVVRVIRKALTTAPGKKAPAKPAGTSSP